MAAGFVAGFWLEGLIAGCAVAWWMLEYGHEVIDIFFAFMRCPLCEGRVERRNIYRGFFRSRDGFRACHRCQIYGCDNASNFSGW